MNFVYLEFKSSGRYRTERANWIVIFTQNIFFNLSQGESSAFVRNKCKKPYFQYQLLIFRMIAVMTLYDMVNDAPKISPSMSTLAPLLILSDSWVKPGWCRFWFEVGFKILISIEISNIILVGTRRQGYNGFKILICGVYCLLWQTLPRR